jgi:uncharacterized protein YqgV (UPF0045/DUF77 family)
MQITAEISQYPHTERYNEEVKAFISHLKKKNNGLLMEVNGMSTLIAGPYDEVMDFTQHEIGRYLENKEAVFVIKIEKGQRVEKE